MEYKRTQERKSSMEPVAISKYIDAEKLLDYIHKEMQELYPKRNTIDLAVAETYAEIRDYVKELQQEQREVDLENVIEEYWIANEWSKVMTLGKFKVIARYFYRVGQLNSK